MPYPRVRPASDAVMKDENSSDDLFFDDVEPIREGIMVDERYHGHYSVCQKLRDIYMATDNEQIKMDCRIAMMMTKKMHERLKFYKTKEENNE